jgi:release factor glutamine methyltransferase
MYELWKKYRSIIPEVELIEILAFVYKKSYAEVRMENIIKDSENKHGDFDPDYDEDLEKEISEEVTNFEFEFSELNDPSSHKNLDEKYTKALKIIQRVHSGIPVQYAIGLAPFYGYEYFVKSGVFIPRPETETLTEFAITKNYDRVAENLQILDLFSGSGAIGITIAMELLNVDVTLVEKSPEAAKFAQKNIDKYAEIIEQKGSSVTVVNDEVLNYYSTFEHGKHFKGFDIIVANPPYIPKMAPAEKMSDHNNDFENPSAYDNNAYVDAKVLANEPHDALFSDDENEQGDGLKSPFQAVYAAEKLLIPGGMLIMEHFETQHKHIAKELEAHNFEGIELIDDLNHAPRFTLAYKSK